MSLVSFDGILIFDEKLSLIGTNGLVWDLLGFNSGSEFTINNKERFFTLISKNKLEESLRNKATIVDNINVNGKFINLHINPIFNSQEQSQFVSVTLHDVTQEAQLEKQKTEFTAMIVHELRAPLTVISGTADMFLEKPQLVFDLVGKQLLQTMKNSVSMMLNLVMDLLDISKIEAGEFKVIKTTGNLRELLTERIAFFQPLVHDKNINLIVSLPDRPLITSFDRERIGQVLNNLLSNAMKFTKDSGEIVVTVREIDTKEEFEKIFAAKNAFLVGQSVSVFPMIMVSITNTGELIGKEQMPKLFTKFGQILHESKDGLKGTGLGLVICRGIVESHNGAIFVESNPQSGTIFSFTLPVVN